MKMLKTVTAFLLIFIVQSQAQAQYLKINKESNGTNTIVIPSGEYWQVVTYSATYNNGDYAGSIFSSTNQSLESLVGRIPLTRGFVTGMYGANASGSGGNFIGAILPGPAFIYMVSQVTDYCFVFKKIISSSEENRSTTSVVIPSAATGDVDVKMEQSADNVTWTECLPGTYNSSTVKRFFRLRAVEK